MSRITDRVFNTTSRLAWLVARTINDVFPEGDFSVREWATGPLVRSDRRRPMDLGVPRRTLSLCPDCNRSAVDAVIKGAIDISDFRDNPGVIEAEIIEEAGRILMRKACEKHGPFEDVLSNHPQLFRRMEGLTFGRDFECTEDSGIRGQGPNSITSGRGTYLVVDLTNRCNMMCSPCFMDANAASYVHELDLEDISRIFKYALSVKPRREITVLFSGGEPTLSPIFLDAVRHAKRLGFDRLQVVTNGIRFAENAEFTLAAKKSGLHGVYLQCDGVSEEKNKLRGLGNYMAVRQQAIENIAAAGMRATLQVTVTNGVNNDALGDIARFAIQNADKIHGVVFQPLMFAGRDENVSPEERYARRYPLTQLAYDLHEQTSIDWQPMRDWFPMSSFGKIAHLCDVLHPDAMLGSLFPEIHPDRGIFSALLVDTNQMKALPIPIFFNLDEFMRDIVEITDSGRRPAVTNALVSLSMLRNFDQRKAPPGFGFGDLRHVLADCFYRVAGSGDEWSQKDYSNEGRWRLMIFNGMWFHDVYNYDFSGICSSAVRVAVASTPSQGEISFSAYYGGGWRKVIEHQSRTVTLPEWHRTHGRHEIYAKGKMVELGPPTVENAAPFVQIQPAPLPVPTGVLGNIH